MIDKILLQREYSGDGGLVAINVFEECYTCKRKRYPRIKREVSRVILKTVGEGVLVEPWLGYAYATLNRDSFVYILMPFNLLVIIARAVWLWLRFPGMIGREKLILKARRMS